jgi:hypothetical protein
MNNSLPQCSCSEIWRLLESGSIKAPTKAKAFKENKSQSAAESFIEEF